MSEEQFIILQRNSEVIGAQAAEIERLKAQLAESKVQLRAADGMAEAVDDLVSRNKIDARSRLADRRLDYGEHYSYHYSEPGDSNEPAAVPPTPKVQERWFKCIDTSCNGFGALLNIVHGIAGDHHYRFDDVTHWQACHQDGTPIEKNESEDAL